MQEAISEQVTPLTADTDRDDSHIEALTSEDEHEAILAKIDAIVDNDAYAVEGDDGTYRAPEYGDIAVLTRTRDFGRDLLDTASEFGCRWPTRVGSRSSGPTPRSWC